MSDTSAPTDPNALLFAAFVYGDHSVCRRKMKAEAIKWAKRYEQRGDFPEPKMISVPLGSVMYCDRSSFEMLAMGFQFHVESATTLITQRFVPTTLEIGPPMKGHDAQWYFYLVDDLASETSMSLTIPFEEKPRFRIAYEASVCRYPWGALSFVINPPMNMPETIDVVARRLEAVLSFWEKLDRLQYIDRYLKKITLSELMFFYYEGTIRMWGDASVGSVKDALRAVAEQMRTATEDEIHTRMMRRLHEVIDTDPNLKHREWLKSSSVLEADLARMKETNLDWYEDMKTGRDFVHYLLELDKKYPP